jgi:hypothetical protein
MEKRENLHLYSACGVNIGSALPLPELVSTEADPDVIFRLGKLPKPTALNSSGTAFSATVDEACHYLDGVGAFLARKGRELIIDPAPAVEERVLRLSILGPVLTLLLHQRGRFVLHASAIEADGYAVAFTAASGQGKSTLAAVLARRGYGIFADDKTALDVSKGECVAYPGAPRLKLWPESIAYLGETPEDLPRLHPLYEKRSKPVPRQSAQRPLPLGCIYLLSEGANPSIEICQPQDALSEIMRNWAGARFGGELLRASGISPFFLLCATLVGQVPIYYLRRPACLAALSEVVDLVEQHLGRRLTGQALLSA